MMFDYVVFGLICYSVGLFSGFIGVIFVISYALKRLKSGFMRPGDRGGMG
jgi:hypothetical protein